MTEQARSSVGITGFDNHMNIGKGHHHAVVIDGNGDRLLSRRVVNDETAPLSLISDAAALAETVWAVDITGDGAALLVVLLVAHVQPVLYLSGRMVNRASDGYRGEGKTDARDAFVIADQARMRRGLTELAVDDELLVELRMLVAHHRDLVADRTRMVNRLRAQMLTVCPALERALDVTGKGPLILLTAYQRPAEIRRLGVTRLEAWLRARKVRGAAALAERVVQAAKAQTTTLPGEELSAMLIAQLAEGVMTLNEQIKDVEKLIEDRFRRHELAEVITSMPGIGVLLGAEFLVATGGDLNGFASADHLAGYAAWHPPPKTRGSSAATCTVRAATTECSTACSTHRP